MEDDRIVAALFQAPVCNRKQTARSHARGPRSVYIALQHCAAYLAFH